MALVAPSLLSADFLHLEQECNWLNSGPADWYHLDIMDGVFVPNISYGFPVVKAIASMAKKPLDAHLMIVDPDRYLERFAKMGVQWLSIHYEACPHLHRSLQAIRSLGMKAGVAINPHTPVCLLDDILEHLDYLLIMSVNPGYGGQAFIDRTYAKVAAAAAKREKEGYRFLIEVDGGVGEKNAASLIAAGADVLVAGSSVFSSTDRNKTVGIIKGKKAF